jgi:hypothetical protein
MVGSDEEIMGTARDGFGQMIARPLSLPETGRAVARCDACSWSGATDVLDGVAQRSARRHNREAHRILDGVAYPVVMPVAVPFQIPAPGFLAVRVLHREPGGEVHGLGAGVSLPGVRQASCQHGHAAPAAGCGCGFGFGDSVSELSDIEYLQDRFAPVITLVRVSGRAVMDEPAEGAVMRAEFCEVVGMAAVQPLDPADVPAGVLGAAELAQRFGVPLLTEEEIDRRVAEGGLQAQRERVLRCLGIGQMDGLGVGLGG